MDQTTRTIIFGVLAVLAVSMAFATGIWISPKDPDQFSDEGTPFFADFNDPFAARAIEVAVYNTETDSSEEFSVRFQDGVWRIPTHYNYPADGQDQLSKTATSVIDITRDSLQSESKDDHQELGVVDPLDEEISSGKGRGTRIRLFGEDDAVLVDYIIGKQPDERDNRYFIRRADEERTYLARLDLEVSTKFVDWIEPDLLQVERNSIVELYINDYSIVETSLPDGSLEIGLEPQESAVLTRESGGFQWALEGLDEASESIKTSVVNAMLTALDDLKIVGVRPKPEILQALLRGEPAQGGQLARRQMESDMAARGYYLLNSSPGLVSNEGALIVGTDEGVSYQLLVGNVFVGNQNEIEFGGTTEDRDETSEPVEDSAEGADAEAAAEEDLAPGEQRSRYLFILAAFDESLLGPRPEPPVMPTPPGETPEAPMEDSEAAPSTDAAAGADGDDADEGDRPTITPGEPADPDAATESPTPEAPSETPEAETTESTDEAPQCDDPEPVAEPTDDGTETETETETEPATEEETTTEAASTDDAPADDAPTTDDPTTPAESNETETGDDTPAETDETEAPPAPTAEELQAAYEQAMREYETALAQYERDLVSYNERVEAGQKKVDELQDRFAEWYYVIPADVFEDLDISRADLIEPKMDDAAAPGIDGLPDFNIPGLPMLDFPGGGTPMPESTDPETSTEPMPETSETPETDPETTPEPETTPDSEAPAPETTEEPATEEAAPSQSGESTDSPAPTPDSTDEPPTMEEATPSQPDSESAEESTPAAP